MREQELTGVVFNVQKFTVHDGPGIRTELFLKGCPMRCLWCSNPESMKPYPEVGVNKKYCVGLERCGWCLDACKQGALVFESGKLVGLDRSKCTHCMSCARACPNDTLKAFGVVMSVSEAMKLILDDRGFYQRSGGGVTISGGDALVQWEFTLELLKRCRRTGIHTCVETELFCERQVLDSILPFTDLMIADLKHMDSAKHKAFTGVPNERVLENLRYVAGSGVKLVLRIPVVPGHNDDEENIRASIEFIRSELHGDVRQLQFLPYRPLGVDKYEALGLPYPMKDMPPLNREEYTARLRGLAERFRSAGIRAVAGTTTAID